MRFECFFQMHSSPQKLYVFSRLWAKTNLWISITQNKSLDADRSKFSIFFICEFGPRIEAQGPGWAQNFWFFLQRAPIYPKDRLIIFFWKKFFFPKKIINFFFFFDFFFLNCFFLIVFSRLFFLWFVFFEFFFLSVSILLLVFFFSSDKTNKKTL